MLRHPYEMPTIKTKALRLVSDTDKMALIAKQTVNTAFSSLTEIQGA